jgi:hypothetical protein
MGFKGSFIRNYLRMKIVLKPKGKEQEAQPPSCKRFLFGTFSKKKVR